MAKTSNYQHYCKDVELVDFLSITKRHLVESLKELDYLLNDKYKDKQFMSFDIETTGLNPEEDFLVGYSFAFDGVEGYYVPVNHKEGPNLGEESVKMIYDRMTKLKKTFAYNLMFDFNFLEFEGQLRSKYTYDMDKCSYYDVMVGMFLADTNVPFPSLKKSAKKFLGWNMDKFEATLGDNYNFHYVSPKDAYDYGCLLEGTLIETKEGSKKIEDIKKGDIVYTSKGENKVLDLYNQGIKDVITLTLSNGKSITCTPDHLFLVQHNGNPVWKEARLLKLDREVLYEYEDIKGLDLRYIRVIRKDSKYGEDFDNFIIENCNKMSLKELGEKTLSSRTVVGNRLKELGIDKYKVIDSHTFNKDMLVDSDNLYYLLGLINADGWIHNNTVSIGLQEKDFYLLKAIGDYFGYEGSYYTRIRENRFKRNSNSKNICISKGMQFCSKLLADFMREHGVHENKSFDKYYKNIPDKYFLSYLRGYFDGNGSVGNSSWCLCCGSLEHLKSINKDLTKLYNVQGRITQDGSIYRVTFNKETTLKIRDLMYKEESIFLIRKRDKLFSLYKGGVVNA